MKQSYSKEEERAVLGAILIDNAVLMDIIELVSPHDFYYDINKKIYTAMIELNNSATPIDTITLPKHLQGIGKLDEIGGAYEITLLRDSCPSAANSQAYAKSIRKNAIERLTKKIGHRISKGDEKASTELLEILKSEPTYKEFSQSDAGNAELLVHLNGARIRYNHTEGIWSIWNGNYWKPDDKKRINELAKRTAKYRQQQAITITDSTKKKEMDFAIKSEDHYKIIACINSAKSIRSISTVSADWNIDPLSLQCENGLLLLSGNVEFVEGKPEYMISQSNNIIYDDSAECPTWENAIKAIFNDEDDMVKFFQRCVGYSLSGDVREQKFFLLHGSGANGKSVIMEVLRDLMGDYARNTRFETFEKNLNKQSNEIARLQHLRLVTANESGDTKRLDTELLKEVTGGDRVTARKLYHESFDYSPIFKLWLSSNTLPKVTDISVGFWRRVLIIPLIRIFIGDDADTNLIHKLKNELPGILNWALRGFEQWTKEGLNPPNKVLNATKEYHNDSDVVAQFVDDHIIKEEDVIIPAKQLYSKFTDWYSKNYSDNPMTQQKFGRRMTAMGFNSEKIGGVRKYLNIKIK